VEEEKTPIQKNRKNSRSDKFIPGGVLHAYTNFVRTQKNLSEMNKASSEGSLNLGDELQSIDKKPHNKVILITDENQEKKVECNCPWIMIADDI